MFTKAVVWPLGQYRDKLHGQCNNLSETDRRACLVYRTWL